MKKTRQICTALLLFLSTYVQAATQFVSLNLCSDRLLMALARPEQIAAMSIYSANPLMMLDNINQDKPKLAAELTALLPYLDKTILLNTTFYPQLVAQLTQLEVKIVPIQDPQTPQQLYDLIHQLGQLTQNPQRAEQLIEQLKSHDLHLDQKLTDTLLLSDTGVVEYRQPSYQILLNLLGLTALKTPLTAQNFSLEKILLSQPQWLISLTDQQGYNEQAELLHHPLLTHLFPKYTRATLPLKYTYCVDHGVWQGAEIIYQQLKQQEEK